MQFAGLVLAVQPESEPVSLDEAKAHLRVKDTVDDAYIATLIAAARRKLEAEYGFVFVEQTWDMKLDAFPSGPILLPRAPVQSVTSIVYLDGDGAQQTWASSDYVLSADARPPRISLAYGEFYPTTYSQVDAVTVKFVAGYDADQIPEELKQAVLVYVAHLYEFREPIISGAVSPVPDLVDSLLADRKALFF